MVKRSLGLGIAILLLAAAVWMQLQTPRPVSNSVNLLDEPRHPVSEAMARTSEALASGSAATATLRDGEGRLVELASFWESSPAVIVFTKDRCPCSMESQTYFSQLAKSFQSRARFVAVMDAEPAAVSKYADDFRLPYPALSAKDDSVFQAFDAERSVYVTLVEKGGLIAKQWPGYSRSMLRELDQRLTVLCGGRSSGLDFEGAPEKASSGCKLFRPVGE